MSLKKGIRRSQNSQSIIKRLRNMSRSEEEELAESYREENEQNKEQLRQENQKVAKIINQHDAAMHDILDSGSDRIQSNLEWFHNYQQRQEKDMQRQASRETVNQPKEQVQNHYQMPSQPSTPSTHDDITNEELAKFGLADSPKQQAEKYSSDFSYGDPLLGSRSTTTSSLSSDPWNDMMRELVKFDLAEGKAEEKNSGRSK